MNKPSLKLSLIPIVCLVALLIVSVKLFGEDVLGGAIQIVLLLATALTCLISYWKSRTPWERFEQGFIKSVSNSIPAILVLLLIGAMAGTWMASGIIPGMIYYGLDVINPKFFLVTVCIVASLISLSTGGSWTTIATVGVGLMGIGRALGFEEGWVAGAVISGAYFGDKVSPLSETTNMAATVAESNLFSHIKYMMFTTLPAFIISLIIYFVYGLWGHHSGEMLTDGLAESIASNYNISPWLFVTPAIVMFMIFKKLPSIVVLFTGVLLGCITMVVAQPQMITSLAGDASLVSSIKVAMQSAYGAMSPETGNEMLNSLVSTKGMYGMLNTVWLIICAMSFGGSLEVSGMLETITDAMIKKMKGVFSTVASTTASCLFLNVATADQYISILLPGKMFSSVYDKQGYRPELLSRTLEDAGTVTSVLVPWNSCGMTQASVLGVSTIIYLPFAFFNWLSPVMTLLIAALGVGIFSKKKDGSQELVVQELETVSTELPELEEQLAMAK